MIGIAVLVALSVLATRAALGATAAWRSRARIATPGKPRLAPLVDWASTGLLGGRRDREVERSLPGALDAVARTLRSGGSLRQAIDESAAATSGPLRDDLAAVAGDMCDGASLDDGLRRWTARRSLPGVGLAAAVLSLGAETGGASAQAVDGVAASLRTNLAVAAEVRALSAQARLSALVIVLAPITFALLAASADANTAAFLLRTPLGLACLALGLGLDAVGWLWMRRLTAGIA